MLCTEEVAVFVSEYYHKSGYKMGQNILTGILQDQANCVVVLD